MDRLGEILTDPTWWMSAVVVALVVSVVGNFATRWTDRVLGHFSERRRQANTKRQREVEKTADWLMNDHRALIYYEAELVRYQIRRYVAWVLLAIGVTLFPLWIYLITSPEELWVRLGFVVAGISVMIWMTGSIFWWLGNMDPYLLIRDSLREVHRRLEMARLSEGASEGDTVGE